MLMRRAKRALISVLTLIVAGSAGPILQAGAAFAQSASREVPFCDQAAGLAVNYNRLKAHIATAGLLNNGAVPKLKVMGFTSIVDLRGPNEETESEKRAVESAGLRYFNIPVTDGLPTPLQIAEFARIVEDANNAPLLIHSASTSRVGAMWTMYRALQGVPDEIALEEGRTTGLQPDSEAEIRTWLAVRTPTK